MVNKGQQLRTKRKLSASISGSCNLPLTRIEKELVDIGFYPAGADQVAIAMEHRPHELYLEILLDEGRCIHSYLLVTFEEKNKNSENSAGESR